MFRLVTLFALVSCTFAVTLPDDFVGRIVNGTDTTIEKHPYQVSIQNIHRVHGGSGAIINSDTIVTTAHSVHKLIPSEIKIRLGSTKYNSGGEVVEIRAIRIHEQFNGTPHLNDIAIIKLARSVRESNTVRYVELATQEPKMGIRAVVTGWGYKCFEGCNEYQAILQEVELYIVTENLCAYFDGSKVKPSMICAYAYKKDACIGDSGGPMVAESKLVGLASWGYDCALPGKPGVYTDVSYFHKWILDTAKSL